MCALYMYYVSIYLVREFVYRCLVIFWYDTAFPLLQIIYSHINARNWTTHYYD